MFVLASLLDKPQGKNYLLFSGFCSGPGHCGESVISNLQNALIFRDTCDTNAKHKRLEMLPKPKKMHDR